MASVRSVTNCPNENADLVGLRCDTGCGCGGEEKEFVTCAIRTHACKAQPLTNVIAGDPVNHSGKVTQVIIGLFSFVMML